MKTVFYLSFACMLSNLLNAQTSLVFIGSDYNRLHAYSSNADIFSSQSNVAALAALKKLSAGIYGERRFMLKDLGHYEAVIASPVAGGNFGINMGYFGSSIYNRSQLQLNYARMIGKMAIGVGVGYQNFKTAGYETQSGVQAGIGILFHASDQFHTGLQIVNPYGIMLNKNRDEKSPTVLSAGFGYDPSEHFFIGAEIIKAEQQNIDFNAGFEYNIEKKLFVRAGIGSSRSSCYFGAGYMINDFRIDVIANLHPHLGLSPALRLLFQPEKEK